MREISPSFQQNLTKGDSTGPPLEYIPRCFIRLYQDPVDKNVFLICKTPLFLF